MTARAPDSGVKRQEQDCRALADRLGGQVVDIHLDNDVSASAARADGSTPALGDPDAVLVWNPDRPQRSPVEPQEFVRRRAAGEHRPACSTARTTGAPTSSGSSPTMAP
jgi:hypothetical protein